MADRTAIVAPSGGDYTTLAAAIAGEVSANPDLTADNGSGGAGNLFIKIQGNWTGSPEVHTASTAINGFSTSADYRLIIYTDSANRALASGWDTGRYILQVTNGLGLLIQDQHIWVDGLQMDCIFDVTTQRACLYYNNQTAGNVHWVSNCRLRTDDDASSSFIAIYVNDNDTNLRVWNTIMTGGDHALIYSAGATVDLYNCLLYGNGTCDRGFWIGGGTFNAYNCVIFGTDNDVDGSPTVMDYCASDDDDGTNNIDETGGVGDGWNDNFENYAGGDFRLKSGSHLIGVGAVDPGSGLFSDDIAGTARGAAWDIGPYQYPAAAGGSTPSQLVAGGETMAPAVELLQQVAPARLIGGGSILAPTVAASGVSVTAQVSQIVGGASIIGSVVSIVRTISFGVSQEGGGEVLVPSIDTGESITIDAAQMVSGVEVLSPTVSAQKTAVVSVAQQVSASEVLAPLVTARINVFSTQNAIIGGGEVIGSSAKAGVTASPNQVAAGGRMSEPMISIAGGIVPEPSEIEGGAEILTPSVIPGVSMFIEIAQILAGGETLTPSAGITKTVSQGQVVGGAEILVPAVTATKTISVTQNQIEAGADIVAPNVVTTKVVIVPITQIEVGGEILSVSPHVGIGITVSVDQVGAVGGMLSPDITTTRAIVVGQTQITAGGVLLAPATAGGVRTVKAGQIVSGGTALPPTVILIGEKIELSGSFASEVSLSGALK